MLYLLLHDGQCVGGGKMYRPFILSDPFLSLKIIQGSVIYCVFWFVFFFGEPPNAHVLLLEIFTSSKPPALSEKRTTFQTFRNSQ